MTLAKVYGPGECPVMVSPGAVIVCRSAGPLSRLIRWASKGEWSHAAIVVEKEGDIVEASWNGVQEASIRDWKDVEFAVLMPDYLNEFQRNQAVSQALWILQEGWEYDYTTFFGMLLFWATRGKLMISGGAKVAICSGLVADCLHFGGIRFPRKIPYFHTPSDLYEELL
jgi:hypothetical protein